MGAAALGPQPRAARHRLRHEQQVPQLGDEVPAGVVRPLALDANSRQPTAELDELSDRLVEIGLDPEDPDERLHRGLEIGLDAVRILAARPLERSLDLLHRIADLERGDPRHIRFASGRGRSGRSRPLTEHEQIGQGVAPESIRAVHPAGDLARREEPGSCRGARLGVHPDAAHHVVRRRRDLHRPGRDVHVGQLLELVVHRRELAPHPLGRQVADVEKDATMGRASALLDLGVNRAGDVVARR